MAPVFPIQRTAGRSFALLAAGLIMILVAACSGAATPAVATPVQNGEIVAPFAARVTPTMVPTAVPAHGVSARQAVINAMHAVGSAGPYHIQSTTTSGGKTTVMTGEVILPDHFHLTTNGHEMLMVGSKTYIRQNGQWVDFPIDIASIVTGMMGTLSVEAEKGITNAQMLGADTANGTPATLYQFNQTVNFGGTAVTSTVKLWVDSLRGLPVQQQIDGVVAGVPSMTLQVITYDPTIKITAP